MDTLYKKLIAAKPTKRSIATNKSSIFKQKKAE